MNLKAMRNVHLYLGVFFAPLLVFFLISGCFQTFNLHHPAKTDNGYQPPAILKYISQVHKNQRWAENRMGPAPSVPFRCLVLLMCVGLFITTLLGIVMAFKYTRPWVVWACLFGGIALPCFLLWVGYSHKPAAQSTFLLDKSKR